ncbi:MAG: winged helix-turn-helix domain-containing protein [Bryobacteraceae bacterium]|jgi:DNA-binding winged helix-turn-helix (wHTH) protein/TolB-like protein/thioredoxin-like negative regulator of GroEL
MPQEVNTLYEFGPFQADTVRRLLLREGRQVPLTSKAFDMLEVLVRNRDRVLEKDELLKAIWPNSFVEEANLAQNVSALRKALGEVPGEHRYIATVPGRGYRFVGSVRPFAPAETEVVVERHTEMAIEEVVETDVAAARSGPISLRMFRGLMVCALALLAAGVWAWRQYSIRDQVSPRSLAVLPFRQLTAVPGDDYLGLGLADAVITRLSNIRQLIVRPTSSVLKYSGPAVDARSAGRELGVEALLDGNVQHAGNRVRLTVQLIRVHDGRILWAESFDERSAGFFAVEDSVSERVAETLALRLAGAEKQELARHYTENAEAYRNYLQGRYSEFRLTPQGLNQAIEYFNRAIAVDPAYALAWVGLADAYTTASDWVLPPRDALPKAEAAARKALSFDDSLGEAHGSLAHALMHEWKLAPAAGEFRRALALNPHDTSIYFAYGEYLSSLGRYDEAVAELNKALKIDPLSTEIQFMMGWPLYLKGDYQAQLDAGYRTIKTDPGFWGGHLVAGSALTSMHRYPEAVAELQKGRALDPDSTYILSILGEALAEWGRKAEAVQVLDELKRKSARQYASPADIATVCTALGDREQAFQWLERGMEDKSEMLLFLDVYPPFRSLHGDPRFQDLVRRVGVGQ